MSRFISAWALPAGLAVGLVCGMVSMVDGTLTQAGAYSIGGLVTGGNYTDKFRNQVTTTTGAKAEFFNKSFSLNADFTFRSNWYNNTKKNTVVSYSPAPGKTVWVGEITEGLRIK